MKNTENIYLFESGLFKNIGRYDVTWDVNMLTLNGDYANFSFIYFCLGRYFFVEIDESDSQTQKQFAEQLGVSQ